MPLIGSAEGDGDTRIEEFSHDQCHTGVGSYKVPPLFSLRRIFDYILVQKLFSIFSFVMFRFLYFLYWKID